VTLEDLSERAMRVRRRYAALEQKRYGRSWNAEEVADIAATARR